MRLCRLVKTALAAGVLFQCGTALTAGSNAPVPATGFGVGSVSGVTAESVRYGIAGGNIESVHLVLMGDTTATSITIGFNGDSLTPCNDRGQYDGASITIYHCEIVYSLHDVTEFALAAS